MSPAVPESLSKMISQTVWERILNSPQVEENTHEITQRWGGATATAPAKILASRSPSL